MRREIAGLVGVDCFDTADETVHAVMLDDVARVERVAVERRDEAETIADRRGKVARRAQHADDWDAHGAARHFDAGVEGIAQHDGIVTGPFSFDDFLD